MVNGTDSESPLTTAPTETQTITITIYDIKGLGLPSARWRKKPGNYYLKVALDGTDKRTKTARGNTVHWAESFYFETHKSSTLDFHIYARHEFKLPRDKLIGSAKGNIDSFLEESASGAITRELYKQSADAKPVKSKSAVEFCITIAAKTPCSPEMEMHDIVPIAKAAVEHMSLAQSLLGDTQDGDTQDRNTQDANNNWDLLLTKITLFIQGVDKISEIHPYAKMAWSILSATYRIILAQKERDAAIDHLLHAMTDIYSFVLDAGPTRIYESHEQILAAMVRQTTECGYFIREYATNKSFGKRVVLNLLSDADSKIKQYGDKFRELQRAFQNRAVLQTEITVLRILDVVESIGDVDLRDIAYATGARFNPDKRCLPGTREQPIDEITKWINSPNSDEVPRVYFLNGVAGFGKSAIAHTIALRFEQLGRLGSSFCFDRADQAQRRPNNMFSTIARDIADLDPQWNASLRNVVRGKRALQGTLSAREQFVNFILKPSKDLTTVGPVVIVIDALDESGDRAAREELLCIIAKNLCDLPANFRVLITARPEHDIIEAFRGKRHVLCKSIDSIDANENEADIALYIRTQLRDIASLDLEWPNQQWCRLLLDSANGLFQWAYTACSAIKGGKGAFSPPERLQRFIESAHGLDGLYAEILGQAFDPSDSDDMSRFSLVMGRILAAKEPLSVASLSELRVEGEQANLVQLVVEPLGSLLSGVTQADVVVRLLHASMSDFLTSKKRSACFFVDLSLQDQKLSWACWRVMTTSLRFNICELETSYLKNTDVMDLPDRVAKHISPHLSYACRYWADHTRAMSFEPGALEVVRSFITDHFFGWLEVLSLLGEMLTASLALRSFFEWIKDHDTELADFAADANNFVSTFRYPISQSTPHIYISALPFAPTKSIVSRKFQAKYPHVLSVDVGKMTKWPVAEHTFEGHTASVTCVSYSPDGKRIVSSSLDRTVRIWDAETGELIGRPFEGHDGGVWSVAYSPDGKRIVSCSADCTARVWDAETGEELMEPFKGHTDELWTVAYSLDGKRIVTGSADHTVRVWDAETGESIMEPFEGHTKGVTSVKYSPDGKRIVSGSYDQTVRVWDAEAGGQVGASFKDHRDGVTSVAYSPDGKRIVSGSIDFTARVFDAETGATLGEPFEGHTNTVQFVAYSPDGKWIVSGSSDQTVRVWDAETGKVIGRLFEGHVSDVWTVAYSPNGKRIVSGSGDHTVRVWDALGSEAATELWKGHIDDVASIVYSPDGKRIAGAVDDTIYLWDAETGIAVAEPFKGHTDSVTSVDFSPDGKRIVSGSTDATVRVWDAETGKAVSEPFTGNTDTVHSVAYSPDGKRIATGSWDRTVRILDAETGEILMGPFKGHTDGVWSIAYSPDGKRIVSGSADETVRVWDTETGETVMEPFRGHKDVVHSVAFSPDCTLIASGSFDESICVWDVETGKAVGQPFKGHTNGVNSVTFSPDGKRIASASKDHTVRLWDAETGKAVGLPFKGHTNNVYFVAYSPDGKRIASGSEDHTVRVWDTEECEAAAWSCESHATSLPNKGASSAVFDTSNVRNGWVLGNESGSELLFWVPPPNRIGLWGARNTAIIGRQVTRLGFRNFVHGKDWIRCGCKSSG